MTSLTPGFILFRIYKKPIESRLKLLFTARRRLHGAAFRPGNSGTSARYATITRYDTVLYDVEAVSTVCFVKINSGSGGANTKNIQYTYTRVGFDKKKYSCRLGTGVACNDIIYSFLIIRPARRPPFRPIERTGLFYLENDLVLIGFVRFIAQRRSL